MPSHLEEATYLPQPQATLENGPNSAAPGANYFWIQGHWQWNGVQYVWQPGYWAACQPDWIWVPATYAWTPRGWVFVPGYWDYPLARRGLVFSPVYFARPVVVYHPAVCLDVGAFSISLFARPAYGHYYFGDYYDDRYVVLGIRPWYYNAPHYGYDPLFTYYRWYHVEHMHEVEWDVHLVGWHDYYRTHPEMRPPHTLVEEAEALGHAGGNGTAGPAAASHGSRHPRGGRAGFLREAPGGIAGRACPNPRGGQGDGPLYGRAPATRAESGRCGPAGAEKVSLTRMSTFKSASLPGACHSGRQSAGWRSRHCGKARCGHSSRWSTCCRRRGRRSPCTDRPRPRGGDRPCGSDRATRTKTRTSIGEAKHRGLPLWRLGLYNVAHPEEGIAIEEILLHRPELT